MGEIAAIATALIWAIGIFPFTEATKRLGALPVNNFRLILAVIILSVGLYLFYGMGIDEQFNSPAKQTWYYMIASGIIGLAIGDYFSFVSFATLGPRLASIFATTAPAFALILGLALKKDTVNIIGILGMTVTIGGVLMVFLNKSDNAIERKNTDFKKGILYAVLGAACQGIGIVFSKAGIEANTANSILPVHAAWIRMVGASLGAYTFIIFRNQLIKTTKVVIQNKNNGLKYLLFGTICGPVVGMSTSMITISYVSASIAQTFFSLVPVFVLLISFLFYKQKITFTALLGCIIATAGVFILIWRDELQQFFVQ